MFYTILEGNVLRDVMSVLQQWKMLFSLEKGRRWLFIHLQAIKLQKN